jgi:hypothetical protein
MGIARPTAASTLTKLARPAASGSRPAGRPLRLARFAAAMPRAREGVAFVAFHSQDPGCPSSQQLIDCRRIESDQLSPSVGVRRCRHAAAAGVLCRIRAHASASM